MHNRDQIDKIPRMCNSPDELQAGDILIFDHAPRMRGRAKNHGAFFTVQQQGFLNEKGGHKESVHAGFVVETDEGLRLAHLVGDGFLLEELDRDKVSFLKRTTHVYRPRRFREKLNARLAGLIKDIPIAKGAQLREQAIQQHNAKSQAAKIKWTAAVAVRSFVNRLIGSLKINDDHPENNQVQSNKPLPEDVISKESICSRFVADAYVSACHAMTNEDINKYDYRKQLMNISCWTVPKTLQAYLYRNTNYDYFVMPHEGPELYNKLKAVILGEIERISPGIDAVDGQRVLTRAQAKAKDLLEALNQFDARENQEPDMMRRSIALLHALSPILLRNTRNNWVTPISYKNVMAFAKKEGIHTDNFTHRLHDRMEGKKYRELAVEKYTFSTPLAGLYSSYRRIGYSDHEARFECKPSFGEWFKISPVRNALITSTLFGFLFWVLPRGLQRTHAAAARNKQLAESSQSKAVLAI